VTVRAGTNTLLGLDPARIDDILPALEGGSGAVASRPPLWDGQASARVVSVLEQAFDSAATAAA
jgi:UDP-N-acetylglucosamine 2-epimerase (non-hydrolysing)